ncbi:MAG: GNAT family N-acetyltransferase [Gemmatimonadales bacterium]|jgi:predicted GNAT family acetyltransferase
MDITIQRDEAGSRFVADVGGQVAELRYSERDANTLDFHHTFVPAELRGGGVAGALAAYALDWARASGQKVMPSCPYVAAYLRRHPEYADLVAP